jgi:hypothetical protein
MNKYLIIYMGNSPKQRLSIVPGHEDDGNELSFYT